MRKYEDVSKSDYAHNFRSFSYEMRITEKRWNDSFYRVMFVYTNILILLNKQALMKVVRAN